MYYVYVYKDPRTNNPFYVGKGCNRRWRRHLFETWDNTTNAIRLSKIIAIRSEGLEPVVEKIATDLSEEEALALESTIIAKFGKICDDTGILTNILDGGQQPPRGVGNPEWKTNNPSTRYKGESYESRYGVERAAEIKNSRSLSLKGRTFTAETKERMSHAAKIRDRSSQRKSITTPDGTFNSMKEAAQHFGVAPSIITRRVKSNDPEWGYC